MLAVTHDLWLCVRPRLLLLTTLRPRLPCYVSFISGPTPDEDSVQHQKAVVKAFCVKNRVSAAVEERLSAHFDYLEDAWAGLDEKRVGSDDGSGRGRGQP